VGAIAEEKEGGIPTDPRDKIVGPKKEEASTKNLVGAEAEH